MYELPPTPPHPPCEGLVSGRSRNLLKQAVFQARPKYTHSRHSYSYTYSYTYFSLPRPHPVQKQPDLSSVYILPPPQRI